MVVGCIVPGCPTRASDFDVTFHKPPRDEIMFEHWSCTIRLDNIGKKLSSADRVCSIHFAENNFWTSNKGVRFLKRYAVPTLFDMCTDATDESSTKNDGQNKVKTGSKRARINRKKKPANKIKKEKDEGTPQKGTKKSTSTQKKKLAVPSTKKEIQPNTPESQTSNTPLKSDNKIYRQNIVIIRGSEAFSVVVEKCNKSSNKRPSEDGHSGWKAKRVARLTGCSIPGMLVENGIRIAGDPKMSVQHPGSIPFLPAAESALAKTGGISELAVILAPSERASPEEGSILKEAVVMSETKGVTPVSCQVQEPHFICAECEEKEVVLKRYKVGPEFSIFLCPTEECIYPLAEDDLDKFLFRNLKNNSLQQCTPTDAPSLDVIVELLDLFDNIIHGFRNQGLKSC